MPSNWLYVESQFPNFNGDESTEERLEQLQNYLYMLVEQMRYTTQNLDLTNVNQTALNNWESALTRPIYAQIEGEGERITQLAATADGIQATVKGQQEDIQDLQDSVEDQIQVIQEVQVAVGEQGGMITDIQGTVTAQAQQMAQLELTAQGLSATVQEQETKLTKFEGTLTAQGENIGTLEGTIQSQSEKLSDLSLTAEGLTTTVAEQTQSITNLTGTVEGQEERLEQLGENLSEFTDTITGSLDGLQAQIDGQIQTWFDREIPTPDNAPANTWESEEDKINHLGDLYYVVDNDTAGGQAYRWAKLDDTYQWVLIEDVEVAKALADAARAQDTADGKRRVFVTQPVPPYDVGDLWAQGDSGDLMRCNTARPMGIYLASDWGKASDYTNDDALHEFVDGTFAQTREEVTKRISQLEVQADSISATVSSQTTTITKLENTSLTGVVTEYYLSTSKTELAGGSWSETAPEWTEGKYMWSRTRTTRAGGGASYSAPTCIAGATGATGPQGEQGEKGETGATGPQGPQGEKGDSGDSGVGVESVDVQYYLSTSSTTLTGGSWSTTAPTWVNGKYMWSKTVTTLSNGGMEESKPVCITGAKGATGATGPQGPQGETGPQGPQGEPGVKGEDGRGVASSAVHYQLHTSGTTPPTGTWQTSPQTMTEAKPYLWTRTTLTYTSGPDSVFYAVSKKGDKGEQGLKGDPGERGIPGTAGANGKTPYLHIAYANNSTGSSGFSTTDASGKLYIGQYVDYSASDSTDPTKYAWTKIKGETGATGATGPKGDKGDTGATGAAGADGTTITSITEEYYLSTSKSEQVGGSWVTKPPTWSKGMYMWTRSKIVYENPDETVYTTPLCDSSWEAVNDVEEEVDNQGQIIQTQESRLSDLEINTNAITATVQRVQTETKTSLEGVEQSLKELSEQVSLSLTSDQVNIAIEKKLSEGVETVKTSTGFTFDDEGLTVSKTGSEMSTKVTEDGMEVRQNNDPVLVADSQGVEAKNLNASTYLNISGKARLEAYETDRVACFWIGG